MKTVLYLLGHAAAEAGRRGDVPLSRLGVRQAEATRDFLAVRPIDHCCCSPLRRAVQTAAIVAAPHGLAPQPLAALTDCGRGAEALADAYARAADTLDGLLDDHAGQSLLVVGHPAVNRTYLAGLMGLPPSQSRRVPLDPCGISVVVRVGGRTGIATLNAAFHLQGVAA